MPPPEWPSIRSISAKTIRSASCGRPTSSSPIADLARLQADGVVAIDMETAGIAEACEGRNIPWSVFRAVSDRASDVSLDDEVFALVNADGSYRPGTIAAYFVRHPGRVPAMLRISNDAKLAAANAASAAICAVERLFQTGTVLQVD